MPAVPSLLNSLQPQYSSLQGGGVNLQGSAPTLQGGAIPLLPGSPGFVGPVAKAPVPLGMAVPRTGTLQGSAPLLQGSAPNLQGSTIPIQGSSPNLQGSSPNLQAGRLGIVSYSDLVNRGGTIWNSRTGVGYSNPTLLAADLGINPAQIQWGNIRKEAIAGGTPTVPSTSGGGSSAYQSTPSGLTVNAETGGVISGGAADVSLADGFGAPTTPAGTSTIYDSPEYAAALKAYQDAQQLTPEEQANQQQLNDLNSGLSIYKANAANQPIPMEFITGQQKSAEARTLALETPLTAKAALLQAKRTGAIEASKFALDTTEKKLQAQLEAKTAADKAKAEANKPVEISPGGRLVNPQTGKEIYSSPAAPKTQIVEVNGHQVLVDQNTGQQIADLGPKDNVTQNDLVTAAQVRTVNGTDASGQGFSSKFINLADFPDAASKASALKWGAAHGITVLNQSEGEKMVSIDNAYTNIDKMAGGVQGLLANTPGLNMAEGLWKSITNKFGDEAVRSFNAWRTAVINNVQALAGGQGSGLRINQAEIDTALKNDLPIVTGLGADTVGSAQAKLNRLKEQLDSWRGTILDKGSVSGGGGNDALDSALNGLGFNKGGSGTPTAARTDRHNNPIAVAVTTGGQNQFTKALDQAGIKWSYGDQFANNAKMSTIRIQGDPIQASRVILANTNAIQGWYAGSTGKTVLAQYGIKNNADFARAPLTVQKAVIAGIYKGEGGTKLKSLFA